MYQFYNGKVLAIPANTLYPDIITQTNYKALCRRNIITTLRQGKGLGCYALIEFASVPERFRQIYEQQYGPPPKHRPQSLIMQYYVDDHKAADFYARYKIATHRNLPPDMIEQYTINAQMLNALQAYINTLEVSRKKSNNPAMGGKLSAWAQAVQAVADAQEVTGHSLPGTERRLRDILKAYQNQGPEVLISGKFNNQNGTKVEGEQQEAMLRELLRYHTGLDNAQVARLYNEVAEKVNWKSLTPSSVGNYRKKWHMLVMAATQGEKQFDNSLAMQVKRKKPQHANTFWVLDGWDVELFYQDDQKQHNRLTAVVVLDASVNYPIGYAIGTHENTELITMALQDAILNTERLFGQKHITLQIQSDNYGKKVMTPIYKKAAEKYTPARVGNAKSKRIEAWFKFFNTNFCQFQPNWSGCGVKSKKQPNAEVINKIKNFFPDYNGAVKQLTGLLEMARAKCLEEYKASYQAAPEDTKKIINNQDFLMYFGNAKKHTNRLSHEGLVATIEGQKITFDSFDPEFRRNKHLDWAIKYNPHNLDEVLAYNEEKQVSFVLTQKYLQPMALYDRQEGDAEQLAIINQYNKDLKVPILEAQNADYQIVHDLVAAKELDNTLAKLLITNKHGQHKDVKNQGRGIAQSASVLLEKAEAKTQKKEEKTAAAEREEYLKEKVNLADYI